MPILKKPAKPVVKPTPKTPHKFSEGDRVLFIEEGTELTGVIQEIKGKKVTIEHEGTGDLYEQPLSDLKLAPEEEPEPEPEEEAPAPKKGAAKKGNRSSLASMLKNAEAAPDGGGGGFPPGSWEALVVGAYTEEDKDGRRRGILEFCGVGDDEVEGKTQKASSILMEADGTEGPGLQYFKRDLLKLGVDMDTIESDEDLDNALETLGAQDTWVDITARPQKNKPEYCNIFLDGVKEDQENKPDRPEY